MQTQPIQRADFKTCETLEKLGLLPPPKEECCVYKRDSKAFYGYIHSSFVPQYLFAPTADQLLPIVTKVAKEKHYALSLHNHYLSELGMVNWDMWLFRNIPNVPANQNLAQYLAEVLIFLLSKSQPNDQK